VKRRLELVQDEAERLKFKTEERRKTQEAKDKAARLAAEAAFLKNAQNEHHDPEALPNRLLDFADESLEFEQSNAVLEHLPIIPKPLTSLNSHGAEANHGTLLSTNVTAEAVKSSSLQQPNSAVSFKVPQSSRSDKLKETLPSYHSWIGDLQAHPSALTSTNNQKPLFCGHSTRDSLPTLRLNKFDGDSLHWSDWYSMFKSIVHDANLSLNGKMQHLENSVIGRAKSEIEGYGYSGDCYYESTEGIGIQVWQTLSCCESHVGQTQENKSCTK